MYRPMIKVERVASRLEAAELEALGVDLLGVLLDGQRNSNRAVSLAIAMEVQASLSAAELVCDVSELDPDQIWPALAELKPRYVQSDSNVLEVLGWETVTFQTSLIRSGLTLSHDDDPLWCLSGVDVTKYAYLQLDVFGDVENSWKMLNETLDDEVTIADVQALTNSHPLLITLDFSPGNVLEIVEALPHAGGLSFLIGDPLAALRNDLHYTSFDNVVRVLETLKSAT